MLSRVAAPFHGYGGMQKYIFSLSEHLVEKNIRVEIVLSATDRNSEIVRKEHAGISYTFLPPVIFEGLFPFWYSYHLFSRRASEYLAQADFDLLHAYGFPAFFYLLRGTRKPVVIQPFGSESFKTKSLEKLANYVMWYGQSRYSMHKAEAIASEGKAQSEEIARIYGVNREKIFLLPDGVDIRKTSDYLEKSELKREDLGLGEDELVIANVNRLEENKGVRYLMDALPEIRQAVGRVKLMVIGAGSLEANLKSQIDSLDLSDSVIHFKEVEESRLFGYLKLADISVTPTLFEGLPIVLLEAMACGLPVITTDISDNSDLVRNGENGYLVAPADSRAISEAVIKIWQGKDMERMGKRSLEIVEGYDWPRVAEGAIAQYEKMICRSRESRV
jgi:glycosyltransferase involved in cell wall biosynthesis